MVVHAQTVEDDDEDVFEVDVEEFEVMLLIITHEIIAMLATCAAIMFIL